MLCCCEQEAAEFGMLEEAVVELDALLGARAEILGKRFRNVTLV